MPKFTRKKKILIFLAIFAGIQFINTDKVELATVESEDFFSNSEVPPQIALIIKEGCADCHSNNTKYPWYSNIQPTSMWLQSHINQARKKLNFSKWNGYNEKSKIRNIDECIEVLEDNAMPPKSYKLMHKEARLTDEKRQLLIDYFKKLQ